MNDRVYPTSRPGGPPSAVSGGAGFNTKGQMYSAALPTYRPRAPPPKRRRRSACSSCCICLCLLIAILVILAGIAALVIWLWFRPQSPHFSVTSVQISRLNISRSETLAYEINAKVSAVNPNKKVEFSYSDFEVDAAVDNVELPQASIPGFLHGKKNTTVIKADLSGNGLQLQGSDAKRLESAVSKGKASMEMKLVTHVRIKFGSFRSGRVRVDVSCSAMSVRFTSGKKAAAKDPNAKCNFKIKIKVFRWYLG
eukprot:TRINITY_DN6467_c0_g1_i1.p1 TRINITY_DN6467_c0_g1~~TRINITY_DN6467_c0_g1_i1.p1  ORF type:complete len:253 (+),score=-2.07 TRINITY_DN6467_c0_g1_i1:266-1024(+)